MKNLSKSDHESLRRAIEDAEKRTNTHIALVVVPASDRYHMYPLAYGALLALALGGAVALFWPQLPLRTAFVAEAAIFVACSVVFDWMPLRLRLVPSSIRRARARNFAHREFGARIAMTHRGGLLLFVSLGERFVELLAERDLHARVGQQAWDRIVSDLTSSVRSGQLAESLQAAISACSDAIQASAQKTV
jgi:putative membrane protein